jgi:superfamily II DNA or RNA helicase
MTGRFTLFDLLSGSAKARSLVDGRVVHAVEALVANGFAPEMPPDAVLAAACLGDAVTAIRRLIAAGILPDELNPDQRRALSTRLALAPADLNARSVLAHAQRTAVFLGLPETHSDPATPLPTTAKPAYGLFPHQRRATTRARNLISTGKTRLLLHMPTGSGKTRTATSLVCDHLREHEGRPVLWFASTRELLEQAAREFHRAWATLGNREVPIVTAWGGQDWGGEPPADGLLVASLQTVHARSGEPAFISELGRAIGLIVFDEAHQAIAPTYRRVVQAMSVAGQPITPILGLSATPGRTFAGSAADEALAEFFDHTKIELDTASDRVVRNPVEYLIDEGYLARPEFRLLGELPDAQDDPTTDSDDDVDLGMDATDYLQAVTATVLELIRESHRRVIVFAASVDIAHIIAATLRAVGVLADAVDGTTSPEVRDTAIRLYKSPAPVPRVLVNYGVLTTGFDAPQTSAVVIARPTRSLVLYSQMVGRGIRGPKAGGNKNAVVVTVVDPSVPAFGSIAAAFTHWEDLW